MTSGKTIALTRQTFVGKVMSVLFNMLSRLVITFLPRSKRLLISWLVTGKFGLGIWNEAGQRLIEFCQENALVITPSSNNTREDSIHGHHQMVNTEIRLIIFFAAKDGEVLYSQQK